MIIYPPADGHGNAPQSQKNHLAGKEIIAVTIFIFGQHRTGTENHQSTKHNQAEHHQQKNDFLAFHLILTFKLMNHADKRITTLFIIAKFIKTGTARR